MKKILKNLRVKEVLLMTGFFSIGVFFAASEFEQLWQMRTIIGFLSTSFLFLGIYSFNSLCGLKEDKDNPRLNFIYGKKFFLGFVIIFKVLSLLGFYWLGPMFFKLSIISMILWIYYSWPGLGAKYIPIASSLVHFVTQIIHFLLGYLILQQYSLLAVLISIYFSLLFVAGHLNHEIIDYKADKLKDIKTNAVYFGAQNAQIASLFLFCLSFMYSLSIILFYPSTISFFLPFQLAFVIQGLIYFKKYRAHFDALKFRGSYRSLYFYAGLLALLSKGLA
ncbi:MAG: UbiA family prenyltransferase [Bacteriovoracaceae bacterium]